VPASAKDILNEMPGHSGLPEHYFSAASRAAMRYIM